MAEPVNDLDRPFCEVYDLSLPAQEGKIPHGSDERWHKELMAAASIATEYPARDWEFWDVLERSTDRAVARAVELAAQHGADRRCWQAHHQWNRLGPAPDCAICQCQDLVVKNPENE